MREDGRESEKGRKEERERVRVHLRGNFELIRGRRKMPFLISADLVK